MSSTTDVNLSQAARAAIDELIDSRLDALNIPGVSLAVTDGDGLLYSQTYGFADVAARRPVEAQTLFEIGSISKSFTAALVVEAALAGRLDLTAPVTDYVPWFTVAAEHEHPITLHHLLQHSAGLIAGSEATTEARSEVWSLRYTPAVAEPGSWFHYSNVGYKTLGLVLEACYGQPYGELVRSRLLQPLGMSATEPLITNLVRPRMAIGYEARSDDQLLPPSGELAPATWLEAGTADGSIVSTAADMASYLRAWMDPGPVLTAELVATITEHSIQTDRTVPEQRYAYGWQVGTVDGHRHLAHGGGMVGYRAHVIVDRDARLGVVVLGNGPGEAGLLSHGVLSIVRAELSGAGIPEPARFDSLAAEPLAASAGAGDSGSTAELDPDDPLVGHWRSHNPWFTNFRTVRRGGSLWLTAPGGVESPGDETQLVELDDGSYRLGLDQRSPERLSFSMVIDGRPQQALLSGCAYHRTFTG